ncbi:nucleotide exchange factor GrpE [Fodinicola feengrottensis]|uniref:nucleotide exchange factor GrpE n=1 Tax=Fodinicola feengrottensis TaxID=435914 RepID=UPI0036F28658
MKAGELYDASMHRPVETVRVDHPSWDGAVVQMVSAGFVRGETVLRRADVVVGQHGSAT